MKKIPLDLVLSATVTAALFLAFKTYEGNFVSALLQLALLVAVATPMLVAVGLWERHKRRKLLAKVDALLAVSAQHALRLRALAQTAPHLQETIEQFDQSVRSAQAAVLETRSRLGL